MENIYHYTSIETLALILRNKTWRFTRLDNLDDIQESEHLQYKLAKQVFVACFTLEEKENIPQWKMYGGTKGIRISFNNKIPFKTMKIPSVITGDFYSVIVPDKNSFDKIMLSYSDFRFFPHHHEDGNIIRDINFIEVEYDTYENVSVSKRDCVRGGELNFEINAKHIFALKSDYWSFQKEVRSFVHILPKTDSFLTSMNYGCDLDYLDFIVDSAVFSENISITLGPDCSYAERIIVESLLEAAGIRPESKVFDSFLNGKVRYKR
ncbi:MAG: hypothetical protein EOP55_02315 [Sphingobacteriales bacterium]|nr:MAG: hypothetical protein EOP55_02315 [Sphingobacteriales bacterium]